MSDLPERGYGTWAQWKRRENAEPERVVFNIADGTVEELQKWRSLHVEGPIPYFLTIAEAGKRWTGA